MTPLQRLQQMAASKLDTDCDRDAAAWALAEIERLSTALEGIANGMGNLSLDEMGPNGVNGVYDGRMRAIYLERFVRTARSAINRPDAEEDEAAE